ncbi:hypothetical protein GFY24_16070 [Nocardia sp. SYP-A9097]|uniref:hypothetical protein n=1 Tax=Nocardia sp. SYP-A9097 TaxID=2663237 RepID=UPI00129A9E93|nr:hypothetical protein [Nocardia sp. SYP-A9097]MRH88943.1 hypothetical protein [Nocardia sp. SYP-A9097]
MTRKDAEIAAGVVLGALLLIVVAGWCVRPGESGRAVRNQILAPTPPHGDGTLTYTAVTVPGADSGAVTASILAFMIFGAALIGMVFYGPKPDRLPAQLPVKRQQPHRSGAVAELNQAKSPAAEPYSSIAPGAVLETVIRNSTLLLVFFNRSTMRSMA